MADESDEAPAEKSAPSTPTTPTTGVTRPDPHSPATKAAAKKAAAAEAAAKEKLAAARPGRPTPKKVEVKAGARSGDPRKKAESHSESSRYTPPTPSSAKISPWYVPAMMFGFLGLGMIIIFLNYMGWPFGDPSNWRLLIGLASILAGILVATRYQ